MDNREALKEKYPDFSYYEDDFVITDEMIDDFKNAAEKKDIKWDEEQFLRSEKMIKLQLKAMIARNEWDMEKYYKIIAEDDKMIGKAIEILNDKNQYKKLL